MALCWKFGFVRCERWEPDGRSMAHVRPSNLPETTVVNLCVRRALVCWKLGFVRRESWEPDGHSTLHNNLPGEHGEQGCKLRTCVCTCVFPPKKKIPSKRVFLGSFSPGSRNRKLVSVDLHLFLIYKLSET